MQITRSGHPLYVFNGVPDWLYEGYWRRYSLCCYCPRPLYSRRRGYGVQSRLLVCLFVRALKGKRLELSTPNLVHTYSIVVARKALTQRSKGQRSRSHGYENRHGCTVASDVCSCYGRVLLLPAWVCMSIRLPIFCNYYLLYFLTSFMLAQPFNWCNWKLILLQHTCSLEGLNS